MRNVSILGWAVVFTVTTLLFACAANDTRMSHYDSIIGPDVTMAQLTEEMAPFTEQEIFFIDREMEFDQRESALAAKNELLSERERMIVSREDSLERSESWLTINRDSLKEKEALLAQRETVLDRRERALGAFAFEDSPAFVSHLLTSRDRAMEQRETELARRENALAVNQAWFKEQQLQFELAKDVPEDILVLEDDTINRCYASITIPAEYIAVASKVMIQDRNDQEGLPARYQTVTKHVKVADEHTSLEEIVCNSNLTDNRVRDIQRALSLHGHNAGPIDGVVGPRTMSAVKEFQKEHGLVVADYLTVETVDTLGVKF